LRALPRHVRWLSSVYRRAVLRGRTMRGPRLRHGRPRVGLGRRFGAGRSRAGRPSSGPRRGTTVRGLAAYRPLRSRRRRSRLGYGYAAGIRRALRPLANGPLGGCGTGGIRNPRGLLRQGCPLGAQQQAQRDQNKGRSQNPPVSRGNTLYAASTVSGLREPVVILHNPQRRHTLQGPADHPACSWWSRRPPLPIVTGPPEGSISPFRARCRILVPDTCTSRQILVRMGQRRGRSPWIAGLETLQLCCAPSFAATPILGRPHPACRHSSIVRGGYCILDRG
jgi:hypothetical protein